MTTTSAAMAAIASTQAATAQSAAHKARISQCKITIADFDAQTATVSEMQEYSDCVDVLYPREPSGDAIIALKVLFVSALIGALFAAWKDRGDWEDVFLSGLLGFIMAPVALTLVAGLLVGVRWLFS